MKTKYIAANSSVHLLHISSSLNVIAMQNDFGIRRLMISISSLMHFFSRHAIGYKVIQKMWATTIRYTVLLCSFSLKLQYPVILYTSSAQDPSSLQNEWGKIKKWKETQIAEKMGTKSKNNQSYHLYNYNDIYINEHTHIFN